MGEEKKSKKGLIIMICNIVIMIMNYIIKMVGFDSVEVAINNIKNIFIG